jgi:DNA modification methylase
MTPFPYPHVFTQKTTRQAVTVKPRPVVFEPGQLLHSITGDCVSELPTLPEQLINCVVTSPPYYGLRDYGLPPTSWPEVSYSPMAGLFPLTIPAQSCCLGLEDSPEAYIAHLIHVFRLVRRVLRDDGVCWVNMGDSYAANNTSEASNKHPSRKQKGCNPNPETTPLRKSNITAKNLLMMPARLALALQADGWVLRSDIVWHKPAPMPESVTDRPTKSHEYIYLLSKRPRYWYDQEAIKEETTGNTHSRGTKLSPPKEEANTAAGNGHKDWTKFTPDPVSTRNKRTVWTVNTRGYPKAHFAVYPPELIEPCVLAGCPPRVCETCGAPWICETEKETEFHGGSGKAGRTAEEVNNSGKWQGKQYGENIKLGPVVKTKTLGWSPTCQCNASTRPGIILDPFAGSGTTGRVAVKHRRRAILIELNEEYTELQKDRTQVQVTLPGIA